MTYYVYSTRTHSYAKDKDKLAAFTETQKEQYTELFQSLMIEYLTFIKKNSYEEEIARLEYDKRLRESYYGGTNFND